MILKPARLMIAAAAAALFLIAAAPQASAVEVVRVISPGGIEAWLVEENGIPILSLKAIFKDGAVLDPPGREGRAYMASGLLDEGAGAYDSQEFQGRLEDLAIHLSFDAGFDSFSASLKTLTENLDEAFEMLRLGLTEPRFDAEPVGRIRSQILVQLARSAENPDRLAARAWFDNAFPDHPYGRPVMGTEETLKALTADDMRRFVAEQLTRDRLVIGVVGDITPARLAALLDSTFGALPATGIARDTPYATPQAKGRTIIIERDIPQSIVLFGHAGLKRDDADFYAASVMHYILGGSGFTARLTDEIRVKRGLAYGVYSYLSPMDYAALFMGRVATENGSVAESLDIIRAEFARMRDDGVSEQELIDAKTYMTGSYPLRLDSNGKIANLLVGIQLEDLGIDYIDRRNGYIEAVTLEDISRVARRLLRPEDLEVVVVGKPVNLEATN